MTEAARPMVSIVIPCRNEANRIANCLDSVVANDYPKSLMEVIIVDGMSDDGTRAIIDNYANRYPYVSVLNNEKRITPAALNLGIKKASGDVIVRMDAHILYPTTYVSSLVSWLARSGADNVGGVCRTIPGSASVTARAIALAMSHPLGVGNAHFRIGALAPRWVDTVPFGCYTRKVFDRIGMFDEDLVRNQDDEFNMRLTKAGGRILLVPEVVCDYYARESLGKLWRMYWQYGYFKPLVARKLGRVTTWRQIIPSAFLLTLMVSALLALWFVPARIFLACIIAAYLGSVGWVSIKEGIRYGVMHAPVLAAAFPIIHFSYGVGFLKGLLDHCACARVRPRPTQMGITR